MTLSSSIYYKSLGVTYGYKNWKWGLGSSLVGLGNVGINQKVVQEMHVRPEPTRGMNHHSRMALDPRY